MLPNPLSRGRPGLIAAAFFLFPFHPATAQTDSTKPVFEEWALVTVEGRRCGFESTVTTHDPSTGQFRTTHVEEFVFKRLSTRLKMVNSSTVIEDAAGVVLSFTALNEGNGSSIATSGKREGDEMVVSSRGQTRRYQLPGLRALGPEKVRRLTQAVPLHPGQTYSFRTFSSDYPQGSIITAGTIEKQELHEVHGEKRSLWKLTESTSLLPGVNATSWVDDAGDDVDVVMTLPGLGTMHELVTDRATCMKQPEGAEIFEATLVHPQRSIPHPKEMARASYRLTLSDKSQPLNLWNSGEQKVLASRPGWCEVEVTAPHFSDADAAWKLPHAEEPDLHPYLEPTSYLESTSPLVQKLAREAVGNEINPVRAARRIEAFVRSYITKKDLDVGFASAEETAKSREGDCTEHAVLCAALGRATGLPTRCVIGFGYIPPDVNEPTLAPGVDRGTGTFAFHMWAEAWIAPDRWMPMDAALEGFDIGHIAIEKTAMDDVNPLIDLNAPIIHLLENLQIQVLKIEPN